MAFNNLGVVSKQVYLNQPEVWTGYSGRIHKQKILVEPMIKGEYDIPGSGAGGERRGWMKGGVLVLEGDGWEGLVV